ncbi:ABC transporter ATP-binding protein [Clostridium ganghwense]|uniref:ABC transporter ATP-binding protein n=1 Tax=Clostridium ganghwense TaxID=312089 RepID=A0ABT4CQ61_9CLOT|nr:ABC transporter ATP-binding protein [Clostridium ganghwense]MCY6371196.1 ABC transporter ATP-binding protein [Clostridium ganghwense]
MNDVLNVSNVKKIYGSSGNICRALNDVSFVMKKGEFLGIMGPSGAGKTTLLNIVSTVDKATSGCVKINGEDILKITKDKISDFRGKEIGFIFQDFNLLDTLTIKENIALPLTITRVPVKEIEKRIEYLSKKLGISEILNKFPYEVSGGQKQRSAAVRAMIHNPSLILADEPTGALDSKSAEDLLETLNELNSTYEATIMLVTHDPFAASYCNRILFLKDGEIFTEINKGGTRKDFLKKILDVLAVLGGGGSYDVL